MEATIVYPVMFFVIFFMLFMGNMFCIRAGIDSLVTQEALTSAAYYADPKLESYSEKEKIPTTLSEAGHVTKNLYRYLDIFDIGGSQSVQSTNLKENIGSYTGYFTGMNPDRIEIVSHKVNNYIIYQTYEVEVKYYLNFPWKFIFHDEKYDIAMTARAEVPVTDSAEFIRNVDLAVDILERTEKGETASENINKTFEKVTAFLNGEDRSGNPVSGKLKYEDDSGKATLVSSLPDPPPGAARLGKVSVTFNCKSTLDYDEFVRQLTNQQNGMNRLTVQEYLDNRAAYKADKRDPNSNSYQQQARKIAQEEKEQELIAQGMTEAEAKKEAEAWMETQAALHDPDQVAGGYANVIGGVGDSKVNGSIGPQWKYRIEEIDEQIEEMAKDMTEEERKTTYLNMDLKVQKTD